MQGVLLGLTLVAVAAAIPADPLQADGANARVVAAHASGVLAGMRLGAALLWPADYGPQGLGAAPAHLGAALTHLPEFRRDRPLLESDGDPWAINVFGHAAFGSDIYLRARQCGSSAAGALAWTAGASVAWEYALEGPVKRPSAIDLAWTPLVGGLLLGELRFELHRWLGRGEPGALRRALRAAVDPLGTLERAAGARC